MTLKLKLSHHGPALALWLQVCAPVQVTVPQMTVLWLLGVCAVVQVTVPQMTALWLLGVCAVIQVTVPQVTVLELEP